MMKMNQGKFVLSDILRNSLNNKSDLRYLSHQSCHARFPDQWKLENIQNQRETLPTDLQYGGNSPTIPFNENLQAVVQNSPLSSAMAQASKFDESQEHCI
jgi:hypothetical protein